MESPGRGSRRKRLEIIVILGALTAFAPLAIDMYLPALPRLGEAFAATPGEVQLTLATFFLGFALGQALYGPISDRFGRKPPLYFGLALFALASAGCALAHSIEFLSWLRLFQALGAAAGMVIARAMLRDLYPPAEFVHAFSALILVTGTAPILAPLFGGWVLALGDWAAIFWVLAGAGVLCFLAVLLRLPESHQPPPGSRLRLGPAVAAYGRLLGDRRYLGHVLTTSFSLGGMFGYIAGSPTVVIELYGVSSGDFGWIFGANALGLVAASQANRLLLRRVGSAQVVFDATLAQALAGSLLVAAAATGLGGLPALLACLFVYVACIGLVAPNASALAMAPHGKAAGAASALLGTLQFSVAAVAALGVGALEQETALPMALVVAAGGWLAFLMRRFLVLLPRRASGL